MPDTEETAIFADASNLVRRKRNRSWAI